jgi:hypothetical protein
MEKRLGIGWPLTNEMIHTKFVLSWVLMDKPQEYSFFLPQFPGYIDKIRNNIVEQALNSECTHLLMMDTDQVYPFETISKLMSHNKDIVAAKVHRRYPLFDPIMYRGTISNFTSVPDEEWINSDLVEIDATGTGCVLFDLKVFENVDYPWFQEVTGEDGRPIGEDIYFYSRAKEAGYQIFIDPSIKIGHLSTLEITEEMYFLFKKLSGHTMGNPKGD